jgi:nitrogen fixation-related uncharacterized protein
MIYWTIVGSVLSGLMGLAVYIYYMRKGQFEDSEEVKYQMFREKD